MTWTVIMGTERVFWIAMCIMVQLKDVNSMTPVETNDSEFNMFHKLVTGRTRHRSNTGRNSSIMWDFTRRPDHDLKFTENLVIQNLMECGWDHVVVISIVDRGHPERGHVLDIFHVQTIPVLHYEISNTVHTSMMIQKLLWQCYCKYGLTNFVWLASESMNVFALANDLFEKHKRDQGALMAHRMNFLVIGAANQKSLLKDQLRYVAFDNIALFLMDKETKVLDSVYTLRYRNNRMRKLEKICSMSNGVCSEGKVTLDDYKCKLFPNKRYGLNMRNFVVLAKEWLTYLYKVKDPSTGKLKFTGFCIEVIQTLANALNFTYTLTPEPSEDYKLSWNDYARMVSSGKVDIGANVYYINSAGFLNVSVVFPVIYETLRGVYMYHHATSFDKWWPLFKGETVVCLCLTLLGTVLMYIAITNIYNKAFVYCTADCIERKPRISWKRQITLLADNWQQRRQGLDDCQRGAFVTESSRFLFKPLDVTEHSEYEKMTHCRCKTKSKKSNLDQNEGDPRGNQEMVKEKHICVTCSCSTKQRLLSGSLKSNEEDSEKELRDNEDSTKDTAHYRRMVQSKKDDSEPESSMAEDKNPSEYGAESHEDSSSLLIRRLEYFAQILFRFLGSMLGQSSLPLPSSMSARLLVWSWCLTIMALVAIFTGRLTADLVDDSRHLPFTTFEEMMANGEYRWGHFNSSLLMVMRASNRNTMLGKLYSGMERFAKSDPAVMGDFKEISRKIVSEKFVGLLDKTMQLQVEDNENVSDLVAMRDQLLASHLGFILPENSELVYVLSEEIMKLADFGIIEKINSQMHSAHSHRSSSDYQEKQQRTSLNLDSMYSTFYICGIAASVAFTVLFIEYLLVKIRSYRFQCLLHK